MNDTPMLLDDAEVIARLRSALDEVAATAAAPLPGARTGANAPHDGAVGAPGGDGSELPVRRLGAASPFGGRGGGDDRRRWLAAAAAIVVLGGATVWALSTRRPSDEQDPATVPPTVLEPSTVVATMPASIPAPDGSAVDLPATSAPWASDPTQARTTTTMSAHQTPWFAVTDPSLTADPITREPDVGATELVQSWTVTTASGGRGFLTVGAFASLEQNLDGDYVTEPVEVDDGTAFLLTPNGLDGLPLTYGYELRWFRSDGEAWLFRSQGLTKDELVALALQAVPGSGLPIVIPDPSATVLTVGARTAGWIGQTYTGQGLNGPGTVQVRVIDDGTALDNIVSAANVVDLTIAGTAGWAALLDNGSIEAVWDAGGGWWGVVTVSSQLARAADGIFASVQPADPSLIPPA